MVKTMMIHLTEKYDPGYIGVAESKIRDFQKKSGLHNEDSEDNERYTDDYESEYHDKNDSNQEKDEYSTGVDPKGVDHHHATEYDTIHTISSGIPSKEPTTEDAMNKQYRTRSRKNMRKQKQKNEFPLKLHSGLLVKNAER